ncbi:MAG: hypothetical protein GY724_11390 [Actinomycetia bacterium]|nr:hypothetical protein [Actinomycetes bacterium]
MPLLEPPGGSGRGELGDIERWGRVVREVHRGNGDVIGAVARAMSSSWLLRLDVPYDVSTRQREWQ